MSDDKNERFPIPPMRLPNGTPGQLSCARAVADGLQHLSRNDLKRLARLVASDVKEEQ